MSEVIKIEAEITLDEYVPYRTSTHPDGKQWMDDVIFKEHLVIHSNEIGDQIGQLRITKILED